ncbi:MAG: hypothetical protein LBJ95_01120 [Oscillospiraceae bacterium]|jgi:hypothetical protein|nr:hypothetical protein [Oscillospiraceae bacterium]
MPVETIGTHANGVEYVVKNVNGTHMLVSTEGSRAFICVKTQKLDATDQIKFPYFRNGITS